MFRRRRLLVGSPFPCVSSEAQPRSRHLRVTVEPPDEVEVKIFFGVWDSFLYGLNTQSNRAPLQEHMQGGSQTRNIRTDLA